MRFYNGIVLLGLLGFCLSASPANHSKDLEVQFLPTTEGEHPNKTPAVKDAANGPHGHRGAAPAHHPHPPHVLHGAHPPILHQAHSEPGSLPFAHFMRMFPMDMPGAHVKVIHIDPNTPPDQIQSVIGDSLLESIMSELGPNFHSDVKPFFAASHAASRGYTPHLCTKDLERFCADDHHDHDHDHLSPLHCLGMHAGEISMACSSQISKSVPVVCSHEISMLCRHELEKPLLQCLEESHISNEACVESVFATRQILDRMKTHNFALVNKRTGQILKSSLSVVSATVYFMLYAVVLFLIAAVIYAFWSRDDETSMVKSLQRTFRELKIKSKKISPHAMEMKSNYSI